ncbi:MAG: exodeoxyribonuclease VII small subunit [Duncaniella sp.]|nr:exodeoxyribonuclease VII small subunit [Duncaniella sp.]MDE6170438.1 exodeoxyribonuclease VII small subunit [Duncaniella sp.]MDE6329016.1 exodeoxyribonuclease VII small subunit [Duncaniella sp.]MDE6359405.1 exodeoxyribonuclease VII small subunit [Duncaniella sp.]MDE6571813.1 exodeoxyribonuclease VII small subunit [Duncaniella sp.]
MQFTPTDEMTYARCVAELEEIIRMMQSDKCDIDHLAAYTRRGAELLKACRTRLTATEEELRTVLAGLEAAAPEA